MYEEYSRGYLRARLEIKKAEIGQIIQNEWAISSRLFHIFIYGFDRIVLVYRLRYFLVEDCEGIKTLKGGHGLVSE
jgi:hypothetical protein